MQGKTRLKIDLIRAEICLNDEGRGDKVNGGLVHKKGVGDDSSVDSQSWWVFERAS